MSIASCVTGIQHLGIPTNDIEKTIDFYKELGFEVAYETINEASGQRVAFLRLKNLVIETYQNNCAAGKPGAINHIALDVFDIEATYDIIKKGDYIILDKEIRFLPFWENGVRFFNILGPNEEIIEFSQMI